MTTPRRRYTLVPLLLLTGIIVAAGLWLRAQRRQEALNRQLIAALEDQDTTQALSLVKMGADPNTPYKPIPSPTLRQLWDYIFHCSPLPVNDSPTAFMIACGAWTDDHLDSSIYYKDTPQLVEIMLGHGAKVNAQYWIGWTPLMDAMASEKLKTISILLRHKANVNAADREGFTALFMAVIRADQGNETIAKDIVPLLLEYGADPNFSENGNSTALQLAQEAKRPDLVALLRQYGAKK